MLKKIRYIAEYIAVIFLMLVFKNLSAPAASHLGGWIGRSIGPKLSVNRRVKKHILIAFPNLTALELKKIIYDMWDNLGRNFAEYPHLEIIGQHHVELIGGDILDKLNEVPQPAVLISAHFANWEVAAPCFLLQKNFAMDLIYRAPNNPLVDKILEDYRSLFGKLKTYPKSKTGMRGVVDALSKKRHIGILIDQKYNAGIRADFFGHAAMTSPAFVQLAQKYKCPLIPARIERIGSRCQFRVTLCEPILTQNREPLEIINQAHQFLEESIRLNPAQWIWLHRRWIRNPQK